MSEMEVFSHMAEAARNFEQPHERSSRLHQLGLDEATFETAVLRGLAHRKACTAFHTPAAPGTRQWEEIHVALRELLSPLGWKPTDARNYSRVVSPDGTVAITVATGDRNTGLIKDNDLYGRVEPRTKATKGRQTRLAVAANGQLSMLDASDQPATLTDEPRRLETWIVLVSTTEHEVRYELSRPKAQDDRGYVVSWWERIVFPAIDIDAVATRIDEDDDTGAGAIEVSVERI